MIRRYSAEYLDQITGESDQWLRRCNGKPTAGIPIGRAELRMILSVSAAVAASSFGVITWRANGRVFTAEPVRDEQAA